VVVHQCRADGLMWLTVREPGAAERRVEVGPGAFSVGRGDECDLVLADVKASRQHALIEGHTDGSFTVRDLASTNGTVVDGRRIAAAVGLHDGEHILIGGTTLTVAEVNARRLTPPAAERPTRVRNEPAAAASLAPHPGQPEMLPPVSARAKTPAAADSPPASAGTQRAVPPAVPQPAAELAGGWSRRKIVLASGAGVLALLIVAIAVAQLVLPGVAASRLRDSLQKHGQVESVSVSAFPAVTLLWHHADKVTVRMNSYVDKAAGRTTTGGAGTANGLSGGPKRLADFLASTSATNSLDARVGHLAVGRLSLESAVLTKRGAELSGSAYASYEDIRGALPSYLQLRSFAGGGGELVFTGAASLLGLHANVRMRLMAGNGALVVQPILGPFSPSVLSLTVFKDPRIFVESVAAQPARGGFDLSARARLTQG
jgi:pSer/pThr/pTyr-binding forkhead associated (FHA) protein